MEPGVLSQSKKLTYDDLLLMIKMLKPYKEELIMMLDVFKTPDEMIKFLDLFAGINITLPTRNRIYHVIFNIEVYDYYKDHIHDPDPLHLTAKRFNITTQRVEAIIDRVNDKL